MKQLHIHDKSFKVDELKGLVVGGQNNVDTIRFCLPKIAMDEIDLSSENWIWSLTFENVQGEGDSVILDSSVSNIDHNIIYVDWKPSQLASAVPGKLWCQLVATRGSGDALERFTTVPFYLRVEEWLVPEPITQSTPTIIGQVLEYMAYYKEHIDDAIASRDQAEEYSQSAYASATAANVSRNEAETSAINARGSETHARESEMAAANSAEAASACAATVNTLKNEVGTSAINAKASENNAKESETNAANSAEAASVSAATVDTLKNKAETSATNAKISETNAKASETNAANSAGAANISVTATNVLKNEAETSAINAKTSETNAKASETAAANSAESANASAIAANTSKNEAATSAINAKASETNALVSETNSASSAEFANDYATSASNSKNAASASAVSASNSAAMAKASETAAANSAESASTSAIAANTSKNEATTSAINAKAYETNAKISETNSANSATSANDYATSASNSKNAASASAVSASNSAAMAKASEMAAANSAEAANASAIAANVSRNEAEAFAATVSVNSHTHSNKSILDNTTASFYSEEKNYISKNKERGGIEPGILFWWTGGVNNKPARTLVCNGASYAIASYPELFAAIGYRYGGSGTYFNVPNLMDGGEGGNCGRFIRSTSIDSDIGKKEEDAIRNITGNLGSSLYGGASGCSAITSASGVFSKAGSSPAGKFSSTQSSGISEILFDLSSIVPTALEVRPVNICLLPLISY